MVSSTIRRVQILALTGVAIATAVLVAATPAQATPVPLSITSDTTLTAADSPWEVTGNVNVNSGAKLTIEPGVEINFDAAANDSSWFHGNEIVVSGYGSIEAAGTAADPITFTYDDDPRAPEATGTIILWNAIGPNIFRHVNFRPGGNHDEWIRAFNSSLTVSDSSFLGNPGVITDGNLAFPAEVSISDSRFDRSAATFVNPYQGLSLTGNSFTRGANGLIVGLRDSGDRTATITDNVIARNGFYGLSLNITGVTTRIQDNTITGNGINLGSRIDPPSDFDVSGNNILGATQFNWFVEDFLQTREYDASNNFWGSSVESEIAAGIHDHTDNALRGTVDFTPFLTAPSGSAPTIDFVGPPALIKSGPSGTVKSDVADFTFSSSEPGVLFECRLDSAAWDYCDSPRHFSGLSEGAHRFEARAVDTSGNVSTLPASRSWKVGVDPPPVFGARIGEVSVSGPSRVKSGKRVIYRVTASNSGGTTANGVELKVKGKGFTKRKDFNYIAAGASKVIKVGVRPKKPGRSKLSFAVVSLNAGKQTATKTIFVRRR